MPKALIGGRPGKKALGRMKVVTVVASIVTFLGSLGVIAANGVNGTSAQVAGQAQTTVVAFADSSSTGSARLSRSSARQQPSFAAPITRSRGS